MYIYIRRNAWIIHVPFRPIVGALVHFGVYTVYSMRIFAQIWQRQIVLETLYKPRNGSFPVD